MPARSLPGLPWIPDFLLDLSPLPDTGVAPANWRVSAERWRCWEDCAVALSPSSGSTHLIEGGAAALFGALAEKVGPTPIEVLVAELSEEGDGGFAVREFIERSLLEFERLGLAKHTDS